MQQSDSFQAVTRTPMGGGTYLSDDERGSQSGGESSDRTNTSGRDAGVPVVDGNDTRSPLSDLPQAPAKHFPREDIMEEILDLTDQAASVALFGPIGIGKSFVANAVLDHKRTKAKFGNNRHTVFCDDLTDSLEDFLGRISDAVQTNVAQLRPRLESSPPLILLLDGLDLILDSLTPGSEEICEAIEEFGSYDHVCLVTTSRVYPDIHGFYRAEIPTLSMDDARDTFYNLCNLSRSSAVDALFTRLDFHPLSIVLLASSVRENNWDEPTLLKAWTNNQSSTIGRSYHQRLKEAIEPAFCSPSIQKLGTVATDVLETIALFQLGVEERELNRVFRGATGEVVDILCRSSLARRQGGYVKMLSPFQFCFLELIPASARMEEIIGVHQDPRFEVGRTCASLPYHPFHSCDLAPLMSLNQHVRARSQGTALLHSTLHSP